MRVILFISRWIEISIDDFREEKMLEIINVSILPQLRSSSFGIIGKTWAILILKSWQNSIQHLKNKESSHLWEGPLPFISDKINRLLNQNLTTTDFHSLSGLDFHPEELARQISLLDQKLFMMILDTEFLRKRFTKAPSLQQLVRRFNMITKWVSTEVATTPNIKERIKTLSHYIVVAEILKKWNNWHSFMAVISGLCQSPVQRLKQTWKALNPTLHKKFLDFEDLIRPNENFSALREAYTNSSPPVIYPILILIKDLTFIEDGNVDWRNKEEKILNYEKMRLLGELVSILKNAQYLHYPFTKVPLIQEFLENVFYVDNIHDLTTLSKTIEKTNQEV